MSRGITARVLPWALVLTFSGACAARAHVQTRSVPAPDDKCWTVMERITTSGKGKTEKILKTEPLNRVYNEACGRDRIVREQQNGEHQVQTAQARMTEEVGKAQAGAMQTVEAARIAAEQEKTTALISVYSKLLVQMLSSTSDLPPDIRSDIFRRVLARIDSNDPSIRESQRQAGEEAGLNEEFIRTQVKPGQPRIKCVEIPNSKGVLVLECS